MSTATPTDADRLLVAPLIELWNEGEIDRSDYWHGARDRLRAAHPEYSGHDITRVSRILAPFPLMDDRYAAR